jgi:hypothetical protein
MRVTGAKAKEARYTPAVTAQGVGADTTGDEMAEPAFQPGAIQEPGRAGVVSEEQAPGLMRLPASGTAVEALDGIEPGIKGFSPVEQARRDGGDLSGSVTVEQAEKLEGSRGRGHMKVL